MSLKLSAFLLSCFIYAESMCSVLQELNAHMNSVIAEFVAARILSIEADHDI